MRPETGGGNRKSRQYGGCREPESAGARTGAGPVGADDRSTGNDPRFGRADFGGGGAALGGAAETPLRTIARNSVHRATARTLFGLSAAGLMDGKGKAGLHRYSFSVTAFIRPVGASAMAKRP